MSAHTDSEVLVSQGVVTVKQAATFLQISRATVYALMGQGELPFLKIGRARRIPHRALVEFAARGVVGGDQ